MSFPLRLPRVVILLCATILAAGAARADLIVNGGFETKDFTGWTVTPASSGSIIYVDIGPGPDTTYVATFEATGSTMDSISQVIATVPGAFYTFGFFYQVGNTMSAANNEFHAWFGSTEVYSNLNSSPGWATFNFNVQATTALTTIRFAGRNGPNSDYLDNVSVNLAGPAAVPETGSSFALLGLACSAVAFFRRRLLRPCY